MIKINTEEKSGITPKLYNDALKPTVKEFGETLCLIPKAIKASLAPLREWIAVKEYNIAETEKLLAHKLENLDPEKITTPKPYVAVPAIQALSYSMDSSEIRNLYANLLAKSMNVDTQDNVHPSFVEIIKQLSPLDAQLFNILYSNIVNPIIDLKRKEKNKIGSIDLVNNIMNIDIAPHEFISLSINNLERLNLISIPNDTYYTDDNLYKPFYEHELYKKHHKFSISSGSYELIVIKKIISITDIGKAFYNICINDK